MSELPQGWAEVKLGDHVYIAGRIGWRGLKAEEYTESGPILLAVPNLNFGDCVDFTKVSHISHARYDESPEIQLAVGDILLAKDGAGIGKLGYVAELPGPATVNSSMLVVRPHDDLLTQKYLFYYLKGPKFQDIALQRITGSATPHLFQKDIKQLCVLIPPIQEQRRIVAKLEQLLARVETARARLEHVPTLLKRFRQSVLAAACSGKLTEDWRGDAYDENDFPTGWKNVELGSLIVDGPQNGLYKPQSAYGSGTLILRIDNFYDGFIEPWDNLKRVQLTADEEASYLLYNGDIVINRVNSIKFLGKSGLVRGLTEPCVFESNMMRFRLDDETIDPEYAIIYLSSIIGLTKLRKNAKHAVNQSSINQSDVKQVAFNRPPIEEQQEIVRRVTALFAVAAAIEARYQKGKAHIDRLTQSLLAKAFRGELVPQNAEDESAEVLLARLQAQRADLNQGRKRQQVRK